MDLPEIYTQYVRPPFKGDPVSEESITEQEGYIPPKVQIEQMIQAGERLNQFRKEEFDFLMEQDVDLAFEDPTRSPGYDLADASRDALAVETRLSRQKEAAALKATPSGPVVEPVVEVKKVEEPSK